MLRRVWYALLGGPGYRVLANEPERTYPAFLLIAVTMAVLMSGVAGYSTHRGLTSIARLWPRLPDFSVTNGRLAVSGGGSAPVRVTGGGAVIVLDSQSTPAIDPLGTAAVGLLLTGDELVLRPGRLAGGDRHIPLTALSSIPLTKTALGRLIHQLAASGVWLGAALNVLYDVGRDFARAAVVAWLAWVLGRLFGRQADWPQVWRIGLAAWTLPMLAEAVGVFIRVPEWGLWLVAAIYAVTGCTQLAGD